MLPWMLFMMAAKRQRAAAARRRTGARADRHGAADRGCTGGSEGLVGGQADHWSSSLLPSAGWPGRTDQLLNWVCFRVL